MLKRPLNIIVKKIMDKKYQNIINVDNLENISFFKFRKIFQDEDKKWKKAYLHNLIDKWFLNQKETEKSFKKLKSIIFKSRINLNNFEKHNLLLIEERIFSLDRHIKILEVNQELLPKEKVGAKFINVKLYFNNEKLEKIAEGNLNITNFRLIFIIKNKTKNFYWKDIDNIDYKDYGFCFLFKKNEYTIRIHDQITLNNTMKNLYEKLIKKWL